MVRSFIQGFLYLFRAFGYLFKPGIRQFVLVPIALNAVLFAGAIWLLATQFDVVMETLVGWLPDWLSFLSWLFWIVFAAGVGLLTYIGWIIVGAVVAAPFSGFLAEAIEFRATGRRPPAVPMARVLARLPRVALQETMKILYFLFWAILFLLAFLVPLLNLAAPILWILFGAWICALDFSDYVMDNNGLPFKEMRRRLWANLPLAFGFGFAVLLLAAIPVLNLVAVPAAVIGATLMWVGHLQHAGPTGGPIQGR